MIEHRFGQAEAGTLGIEEELFFVRGADCATAPLFTAIFGEGEEGIVPELFECFVETRTPVVAGPVEALVELRRLREAVAARAAEHGALVHGAGSHALARGLGQPIVPARRYEALVGRLGWRMFQQLVCGLHVHVSMPDAGSALRAFEAVVPWLPVLLALSANSPFAGGKATGRRSERAERLLKMPTGGTPPLLPDWDAWQAATGRDSTRRHWDAWPRPEYGTLEVRVMDMQTDVRRSAGFAAIVQALALTVPGTVKARSRSPQTRGFTVPGIVRARPYDRALYERRRREAAVRPPDPAEVEALAAAVEPHLDGEARGLARLVLEGRPEAERQLEVAAADGIPAVPRDVVARTLGINPLD